MAVKDRKKYTIYLTEKDAELVRHCVELEGLAKGGEKGYLSNWLDDYVRRYASEIRRAGLAEMIENRKKLNREQWSELFEKLADDEWWDQLHSDWAMEDSEEAAGS